MPVTPRITEAAHAAATATRAASQPPPGGMRTLPITSAALIPITAAAALTTSSLALTLHSTARHASTLGVQPACGSVIHAGQSLFAASEAIWEAARVVARLDTHRPNGPGLATPAGQALTTTRALEHAAAREMTLADCELVCQQVSLACVNVAVWLSRLVVAVGSPDSSPAATAVVMHLNGAASHLRASRPHLATAVTRIQEVSTP